MKIVTLRLARPGTARADSSASAHIHTARPRAVVFFAVDAAVEADRIAEAAHAATNHHPQLSELAQEVTQLIKQTGLKLPPLSTGDTVTVYDPLTCELIHVIHAGQGFDTVDRLP